MAIDSVYASSPPFQTGPSGKRWLNSWIWWLDVHACRSSSVAARATTSTLSAPPSPLSPSFPPPLCDLAEDERAFVLEKFRQVTARWNQMNHGGAPNEDEAGKDERSHMIIVTDACLPLLASGELPLNAHLLINYELPAKKETYGRRLATCLTADGFVINMVVGGEVVTLKSIEESSNIVMQEMPMQILDIL
ncbi:ATP-dependent RNA helicase eIF4A isoform X3 [Cajanus cajan]|uniref:ATP-dependent RNA helicase eIF4A isoform X3 n=1 Tax=Cajanus cajan TaxID=3821 RepID=UPI00098DC5C9|nr:ATP-dependent RNA helicase eIF4A isoform X3 [Cajanus cajan]